MGDSDILIGGQTSGCATEVMETSIDTSNFLEKDLYLGEFSDSATLPDGSIFNEKAKVRNNLDIYSRSEVEDMIDTEHDHMLQTVNSTMRKHLETEDPHGSNVYTDEVLLRQTLTINTLLNTLKANLESLINKRLLEFVKTNDFETFKSKVLKDTALAFENVYTKAKVYTKDEINVLNSQFVKINGTTPFTKPQEGVEPKLDRHLATKRYVDNVFSHATDFLNNIEFRTWINQRLAAYAKLSDTYSRDTIDTKLQNLVNSVVDTAINKALTDILTNHLEAEDPHGDRAYVDGKFVTKDSIANLSKEDIPELIKLLEKDRDLATTSAIKAAESVWKTSGPVQTTVGFVEKDTDFNENKLTLLSIMDAVFYGKKVQISTSEQEVAIGDTTDVTITIHGATEDINKIIIKQGNEVLAELEASDLDDNGLATVKSLSIMEDSEFTVEVSYYGVDNPTIASTLVKVGFKAFIGLIPKFETASTITWDRLVELVNSDSINNLFFSTRSESISELDLKYNFEGSDPMQIFVAIPADYPDIVEMSTSSLQFGIGAFNVVLQVPINIKLSNGETKSMLYKYFVYKQPIVTLSTKVTFKFD